MSRSHLGAEGCSRERQVCAKAWRHDRARHIWAPLIDGDGGNVSGERSAFYTKLKSLNFILKGMKNLSKRGFI